jgi:hypothetical protein
MFAGGYPPTIVAAVAFHNRVRDGSEWGHYAIDTRKLVELLSRETLKPAYKRFISRLFMIPKPSTP